MKIDKNNILLFVGDSITDCGRAKPVGQRRWSSLGDGYVSIVDNLLAAFYPERPIRILNTGISGNTVGCLSKRWQTDVLDLKPDWLSIMIGVNDVWRHFDSEPGTNLIDAAKFEGFYREILERSLDYIKNVVMISPFFLETNRDDPMRKMVDAYGAIAKKLASERGALFVDSQAAFDSYLEHESTHMLSADRVHPNSVGHTVIARAFLDGIGFDWTRRPDNSRV